MGDKEQSTTGRIPYGNVPIFLDAMSRIENSLRHPIGKDRRRVFKSDIVLSPGATAGLPAVSG